MQKELNVQPVKTGTDRSQSRGLFGISDDYIRGAQSLDQRFIRNRTSSFLFEANSDAMEPTIFNGDILVVDRSIENVDQRVCIVSYNGEFLCKRVFKSKNSLILKSDNSKFQDINVENTDSASIWGVVTSRHGETRLI